VTKRTSSEEKAARVWSGLKTFVDAHERRGELQEILGLGRGLGRVKLLLLLLDGPLTLREIAEASGIDAPYATVIVDKLEGLGLVERTAHPDDNRRKLAQLTPAGRGAAVLAGRILAEPPTVLVDLTPGELAQLDDLVKKLTAQPSRVNDTTIRK
jgi:DNA-binding MarR family transcriptional regulator